jgi:pimeloyl-ACP methyl ester carboxylesterase
VRVNELLGQGIYSLTMEATGTDWEERFIVGVPQNPDDSAPLLVCFHQYSASERDVFLHTDLFSEALERGWYVLAPLGAHQVNCGVAYAQDNTRVVVDWLSEVVRIDPTRIYGLGFSMGGGNALNFAARYQDPNRAMFAAVVNHTGTVSLRDIWHRAQDTSILEHPLMFGGSPYQHPFAYAQASTIEMTPWSGIDERTDLARNLGHVAVQTWCAQADPLDHLVRQTRALIRHLLRFGGSVEGNQVRGSRHFWDTLDEVAALDFLADQRLVLPTDGTHSLLALHDGRWLHFDLEQAKNGAFSAWRWHSDPRSNLLYLDGLTNIKELRVRTEDLGLAPNQTLRLILGRQAGSTAHQEHPTRLVLTGFDAAPRTVLREGRAVESHWNPARGELTIEERDAAALPLWVIVP